jgi:NhaC family Na+:H+ antiporter
MASQMYGGEFRRRGIANDVWGNIVNSSAGITSVLVPWNTCAVYMVTILGVPCVDYLPYALFCFGYPLVIAVIAALFGSHVGWFPSAGKSRSR